MPLTTQQALEKSLAHWRWLATNPGKSKYDYFAAMKIGKIPLDGCYLCQYARDEVQARGCLNCPLWGNWGVKASGIDGCYQQHSLYDYYCRAYRDKNPWKQAHFATLLADRIEETLNQLKK